MSDVPGEILLEILSWLPVVPLLRFRSVSKSWKCLIDSNEFIRHHLNHSLKNTNSNHSVILVNHRLLYSTDFDSLNETNLCNLQELVHPLKNKLGIIKVLGSCHGLLALSNYPFYATTMLWNPYVRRFHELPYERFGCLDIDYISHGFGYDVVSDDYKLVRLVQAYGDADLEVRVYSLKSNSWRRIHDVPYRCLRYRSSPGELANGALHWDVCSKVDSDTASLVMAFDLGIEEFRFVSLPEITSNNHTTNVFVLGGCFGVMFYVDGNVNVWVMKEYGVQESWTFLFTFGISDVYNDMKPIAYSKCNTKVLVELDARVPMWYDLDKKTTDFPMVEMPENSYAFHTCLESLVLLDNSTCDFDLVTNTMETQERINAKKRKSTSLM